MGVDLYLEQRHVRELLETGINPLTHERWYGTVDDWYKQGDGNNLDRVLGFADKDGAPIATEPPKPKEEYFEVVEIDGAPVEDYINDDLEDDWEKENGIKRCWNIMNITVVGNDSIFSEDKINAASHGVCIAAKEIKIRNENGTESIEKTPFSEELKVRLRFGRIIKNVDGRCVIAFDKREASKEDLPEEVYFAEDRNHLEKKVEGEIKRIYEEKQKEIEEQSTSGNPVTEEGSGNSEEYLFQAKAAGWSRTDEEKKLGENYYNIMRFNDSVRSSAPSFDAGEGSMVGRLERLGENKAESFGTSDTAEDRSWEMMKAVDGAMENFFRKSGKKPEATQEETPTREVEPDQAPAEEPKSAEAGGMMNEADCMFCSLKHVSTAYALWNEFQTNQAYQLEFVMALGELRAAELHLVSKHPDECYLVRELRLAIEQGAHAFDAFRKVLMVIAEKAEIFA